MAKEVNIPVKAEGAEQTRDKINQVGKAYQAMGDTAQAANRGTGESARQGASGVEKLSAAQQKQSNILTGLAQKAAGMFGVWKAVDGVIASLDRWADRLRTIRDLQRDIHGQALSLLEAGQSFEIQEGTAGRQGDWAGFLARVQKAGRLRSVDDALQVSTAFSIAMGPHGGTEKNKDLLLGIAPMFGATNVSGGQAAQFIDFAGTAGIEPTETAYKEFYAQVIAGFRSSKSKDFGQFLTGLQSGTTGMILQGASPQNAVATYSAALSVTKNEAAASTLTEQMTRLSSGAYAKPREALEGFEGVAWGTLTPDEQFDVLLRYAGSLPENQRVQLLTEAGFSPELASGLSKIASPDTLRMLETTRHTISRARASDLDRQIAAFDASPVGKERLRVADSVIDTLDGNRRVGDWQARLKAAEDRATRLAVEGDSDFMMPQGHEAYWLAYSEMHDGLGAIAAQAEAEGTPEGKELAKRARALQYRIGFSRDILKVNPMVPVPVLDKFQGYRKERHLQLGPQYEQQLEGIFNESENIQGDGRPLTIHHHYHNETNYFRSEGVGSPRISNIA